MDEQMCVDDQMHRVGGAGCVWGFRAAIAAPAAVTERGAERALVILVMLSWHGSVPGRACSALRNGLRLPTSVENGFGL